MNPKRLLLVSTVLGALAVLAAGCDDVIEDPTFRMWCGESLCAWKLENGSIQRAPTWHKKDHGVEFVETPTTISQETTKNPKCLEFTTIADVEPGAQMTIGLDFNRDGTIDAEQPIAATGFREAKTIVTAPAIYDGIRFVLSKKGSGRAVLAQMRVQSRTECTAPPSPLKDLPLGSGCTANGECQSGICCEKLCAECCAPERTCDDGGACERRDAPAIRASFRPAVPHQCNPGRGEKLADDACLANDDCASGVCEGAWTPSVRTDLTGDGGTVACPASFPDAGGNDCVFGALRAGRCK